MDDIIINVSKYMRENIRDLNIDNNEKEVLAYISMALFKMYLIGETSHKWTEDFKKIINEAPKEFLGMLR